jgi:hypothetical protein
VDEAVDDAADEADSSAKAEVVNDTATTSKADSVRLIGVMGSDGSLILNVR